MGQTLNAALKSFVTNRKGLHGEVARLKMSQKKLDEELKEVHKDVGKILELLERKGDGEKK
jgi:hypothetical protein